MKYIIFQDKRSGLVQPVLFGEHTTHSKVTISGANAICAGFVDLQEGNLSVYGRSDSMNLDPSERDLDYILKMFMGMGEMFFVPALNDYGSDDCIVMNML